MTRTERMERLGSQDVVATWPCKRCNAPVTIVDTTVEILELFNRMLEAAGDRVIDENNVVLCPRHRLRVMVEGELASEEKRKRITEAIKILKAGGTNNDERESILLLHHEFGQGEGDAMIRACRASRKERGQRKPKESAAAPTAPTPAAPPASAAQAELLEPYPAPTRGGVHT